MALTFHSNVQFGYIKAQGDNPAGWFDLAHQMPSVLKDVCHDNSSWLHCSIPGTVQDIVECLILTEEMPEICPVIVELKECRHSLSRVTWQIPCTNCLRIVDIMPPMSLYPMYLHCSTQLCFPIKLCYVTDQNILKMNMWWLLASHHNMFMFVRPNGHSLVPCQKKECPDDKANEPEVLHSTKKMLGSLGLQKIKRKPIQKQ